MKLIHYPSIPICILIVLGIIIVCFLSYRIIRDSKDGRIRKDKKKSAAPVIEEAVLISIIVVGICLGLTVFGKDINDTAAAFIGALLTWIFKDYIIGIFVFLHLYIRRFLRKGNWIVLPERHIDGEVEEISLLSVVVKNWDNTQTVLPIYLLHENAFVNWQEVADKQTHGRRMLYTFHIDTESIHPLSTREWEAVRGLLKDNPEAEENTNEMLNISLFRTYIQAYLCTQAKSVSKSANLMVRILESDGKGLPIQIYAYLSAVSNHDFSNAQSQIVEDILAQIPKFGLSLFQTPSAADITQVQLIKDNQL